jgi:hypothetical protein
MNKYSVAKWIGEILVADYAKDIGKFDRIHHWQIGAALINLREIEQALGLESEDDEC